MKKLLREFHKLLPLEQKSFLKENLIPLSKKEKIVFLKETLKGRNTPDTIIFILNQLQKLKYRDNFFYKKFFYHINDEVVEAAKKGASHDSSSEESAAKTLLHLFQEGNEQDREFIIDNFFQENGKLPTDTLVALLSLDSKNTRQKVIDSITDQHEINAGELSAIVIKGVVWYTRSSIVEILGKRKSEYLFEIIDDLLEDQNVEVKLKLIHALAEYNRDKVKKYLHILCEDKFIWVRREAKKVLAKI